MLRTMWSGIIALGLLGALIATTVLLDWSRYLVLCAIGFFAGVALAAALLGSERGREWTILVLAAFTLPLLAAHLAVVGAGSEAAFSAYSAHLTPFLVHAFGALLGGLGIAAIWRRRPPSAATEGPAAGAPAGNGGLST
jgi:hypothetical protein